MLPVSCAKNWVWVGTRYISWLHIPQHSYTRPPPEPRQQEYSLRHLGRRFVPRTRDIHSPNSPFQRHLQVRQAWKRRSAVLESWTWMSAASFIIAYGLRHLARHLHQTGPNTLVILAAMVHFRGIIGRYLIAPFRIMVRPGRQTLGLSKSSSPSQETIPDQRPPRTPTWTPCLMSLSLRGALGYLDLRPQAHH